MLVLLSCNSRIYCALEIVKQIITCHPGRIFDIKKFNYEVVTQDKFLISPNFSAPKSYII